MVMNGKEGGPEYGSQQARGTGTDGLEGQT